MNPFLRRYEMLFDIVKKLFILSLAEKFLEKTVEKIGEHVGDAIGRHLEKYIDGKEEEPEKQ